MHKHSTWQSHIVLLNCDVCCSFPLPEMLGNVHCVTHCTMLFIYLSQTWNLLWPLLVCVWEIFQNIEFLVDLCFRGPQKLWWHWDHFGDQGRNLFYFELKIEKYIIGLNIFLMQVSPESAYQFGELVADPVTNELLHYTEKPETFVCNYSEIRLIWCFLSCV